MDKGSVLCVFLLLCSLSGAELQDNEITEQGKVSPESVNVPEQPHPCLSDLHAVLRDMSAKLAVLQTEMKQVQALNQEQAAKLREVDTLKLQQQEQATKVDMLKHQQQEQGTKLKEVDSLKLQQQEQLAKLKELQTSEVDPMKEQLRGQAAELKSIKARTNVTENHVDSLRRDKAVRQVAFSASLVKSGGEYVGPFNTDTPLVFRGVISNIGGAYSENTGLFTAPVRGAYHFELRIYGEKVSGAWLVKNGERICIAWEQQTSEWGNSSNGASLLLEVGDVVSVLQYANTKIYDSYNHHTTFSGHLLFLM